MGKTIDSIIDNYDKGYTATRYGTVEYARKYRRYDYDDLITLLKKERANGKTAKDESSLHIESVSISTFRCNRCGRVYTSKSGDVGCCVTLCDHRTGGGCLWW